MIRLRQACRGTGDMGTSRGEIPSVAILPLRIKGGTNPAHSVRAGPLAEEATLRHYRAEGSPDLSGALPPVTDASRITRVAQNALTLAPARPMFLCMARLWFSVLVSTAAVFCGCSPEARLARKIAEADGVVLTQRPGMNRWLADLAPLPSWLASASDQGLTRLEAWLWTALAILLVCLGLIGCRKFLTRRRREKEFSVGTHDAPPDFWLMAQRTHGSPRRCPRPRPFFFRKARLKAAGEAVRQSQLLCSGGPDPVERPGVDRPAEDLRPFHE